MTHKYYITGMTCNGCSESVKKILSAVNNVLAVTINLEKGEADITMSSHVPTAALQEALKTYPKYQLSEVHNVAAATDVVEAKSWFMTYKPLLLILIYISTVTLLVAPPTSRFDYMLAMRVFMGGFFLVFSFFKLLDLKGFAESYSMYDIIAKYIPQWGYVYAFMELILGLAYITDFQPLVTNLITFILLSVSIVGVLQSIFNKRKIKCVCLGAIFDLPMSIVTAVEDGLMILMSAAMLFLML